MFSNGIFLAYNKKSQIKEFKKFQNDNTKERQKFETKKEKRKENEKNQNLRFFQRDIEDEEKIFPRI